MIGRRMLPIQDDDDDEKEAAPPYWKERRHARRCVAVLVYISLSNGNTKTISCDKQKIACNKEQIMDHHNSVFMW